MAFSTFVPKLNQDPLEIFFGTVRASCGCNVNPTSSGFEAAYGYCSINYVAHNSKFNCADDKEEMLVGMFAALVQSSEDPIQDQTNKETACTSSAAVTPNFLKKPSLANKQNQEIKQFSLCQQ